jgi:hypothetical protein
MNDQPSNDDIRFDRLVDGELSAGERRALLESLDARPDGWRRCALAFLEAQSWRRELGLLAGDEAVVTTAPMPAARGREKLAHHGWSGLHWLGLAASLALAFGLGLLSHQRDPAGIAQTGPAATEQLVSVPPPGKPAPTAGQPNNALNLWVRDDSGQLRRVRVPLVDAQAIDRELGLEFQSGVPDDLRNQLQNQGYAVESKRQYAPLWLENGRPMVVPVEDTKIVPVSNRVY